MKKCISSIICAFIAIVVAIGLTTGSAFAQSPSNTDSGIQDTNKTEVPDYPCNPEDVDNLYPNPNNNTSFYQCAPYGLVLMSCPSGLVFNGDLNICDLP